MKEVGEYRNFIDCTSRGSGKNVLEIEPNGHEPVQNAYPGQYRSVLEFGKSFLIRVNCWQKESM